MFHDLNEEREKCIQTEQKLDKLANEKLACNKCKELDQANLLIKQLQIQIDLLKSKNEELEDELKLPTDQDILKAIDDVESKPDKRMDFKFAKKEGTMGQGTNEPNAKFSRAFEANSNLRNSRQNPETGNLVRNKTSNMQNAKQNNIVKG